MKTPDEHLAVLRQFQAWRLGDGKMEQPDPKEITAALDWAISGLEENLQKKIK